MKWTPKIIARAIYYFILSIFTGGVAFLVWLRREKKEAAEEERKYLSRVGPSGRY